MPNGALGVLHELCYNNRMAFPAKYAGTCRSCGDPFSKGEPIEAERGYGAWHDDCPPPPESLAAILWEVEQQPSYKPEREWDYTATLRWIGWAALAVVVAFLIWSPGHARNPSNGPSS